MSTPLRKSSRAPTLALWIGFSLICFVILVAVLNVQISNGPVAVQNSRPVENKQIRFDVISDVDQEPVRRMLEIMLPRRISINQLQVLSHQIKKSIPAHKYRYISIRYQIPEMPYTHGIWAKAAFKKTEPEEIKIYGLTISDLVGFKKSPIPLPGQIVGNWVIEETANSSRRVLITRNVGKYYYQMQWSPESEFNTIELRNTDQENEFVYLDGSENTVYRIRDDGCLELSSPGGVFAIGRPLESFEVPVE